MSWVASAQRGGTASSAVPPDLDQIMDEEFLKQLWQEADDFSDRRRIRARMYKLREKRLREMVQNDEESLGVLTMTDEGDSALRSGMIESDVSTSERETSSQRKSSIEIKMTSNTESSSRTMRGVDNRLDSRRLVPSDDEIINDRIREVSKGRGTRYQEALSQYESEDDPSFMSISKSNYCVQSSALTGDTFQSMKHKEVRDSVSPMRGSFDKKLVGEDSETFFTSDEEVSCNKSESDSAPSRHASKTKSTVRTNSSKAVTERKVSKEFEHNSTRQSVKTSPTSPTRKQPAETTILTTKKMTRNQVNSQRESPTSPLKSSTDKKSPTQPGSRLSTNNKTKKTQPAHGVEKSLKNEYQRLDKYINESIDNDDEIINEEEEDVEDESGNMVRMIVQTRRKKDGTQIISRRVARSMKIVEKESDIDEILIGNPDHEVINREVEEKEESDGSKIKIITETRRRPDGIEYTTKNVLKTSKIFDYDHPEDISYSENDELLSSEESTETDKHGITIRTVIETRRKRDGVEYTTKKVYKTSKVDSSITPSDDDEILDTEETEETQSDGTVLKIIIEKRRTKNGEEYTHRQVYRSRKMTLSGIDVSQGMPSMDNDDEIIDRKEKEEFDGNNKKIRVVTETRRRKDGSSYSFDYTLRSFKGTETDIQKMPIQSSNLSNINVSDTDDIIKEDVKEDKQKDGSIVRTIIERRRARDGTEYLRHRIMKIPKLPEPELLVGSLDDEVLEEDVKEKVLNDGTRCKAITERRRSSLTGVQYTLRRKSTVYQHPSHIIQGTDEILDENVTEEEAEDGILIRTIIRRYQRPDETVYTTHDIRKTYRNPVSVSIEGDENDELIDRSYDERETKDGFIIKTIVETRCRTDGTHYTVERMEKVSRLGDDVQVSFKGNSISSGSPGDTVVSYEEHEEPVNDGTIIRTITEVRRRKDGTEYTNKTTIKSTQVLVPEHETSYVIIKADSKGDEIGSLFPSLDDEIVYTRKKKDVDEKGNPITVIIETRQSKTTGEKYNLTKKVHTTDVIATEHGEKVLAKRTTQSGNEGFPRKPKGALNDISAARIKTTVQPLKRDSPKPSMVSSTNKRTTREQTVTKTTSKTSPSLKKTPTGPEKRRYDMPQRGEDSDSSASRPSKPTTKSSPNSENKVKPRKPTTLDLKDKEKARTTDRSYPGDESLVKSSQRTKTVERKSDSSPDQKSGSDSPGRESPRRAGKPILQSSSKPDQKAKPSPERVQSSPKRGRSPFRVESSTPREGTPSRPCCKYSPEQPKPISQITRKKLTEEKPKNVGDVRKYTSNLNRGSPRKIESEKLSKFDKSTKTSPEKKSSPTRSTETNVTESLKHSDVEVDRKLFGKKQINKRISDSSPSSSSEDDQLKTSIISYKSTGVRKTSKEFAKIQEKLPSKDKYNGVDSIDTKLNGFSGKTTKANQTPTRDSDSVFPKIFPASEKSGRTTKDNRQEESIQRVSKITSKRSISEKTTTESIESEPITSKKKTDKLVPVDEPLCVRKYIHPLGSSSDTEEDDEEKKHTKITTEETKLSSTRLVIDAMGSEPKSHDAYPLDTNENEIPERYDMVSPLRERSKSPLTKDVPHRLRTSDQSPPPFVKEDSPSRFITGKPIDQGPNTNKIKRLERSNSNKKIIYEDLEINATNLPTYLKDIEYITDITVLEKLLQKAETYEERRIIRGHIRTLKKNDTKPASPSPYKRFVDSTTPSKPSPTASPIITRRTETTTTSVTSNSTHQMKPTSYSRTKKPLTIGAEPSSPKRTSIDYGRSDRKSSDKDNVRLKKGSSDESASSRKSSVDEPNIKRKTSSDILEKSRKSSVEEPQWKTSRLRKTSNDLLKDKKTSSTESTTKHSEPSLNDTNRTRKISPDNESRFRKSSPEYSTRNRKDSPDNLKSVISPESKPRCSKPLDSHAFRDKKTYESPTYSSPEEPKVTRKSSDTKVRKSSSGDVKPIKLTSIDRDREATSKTSKESTKVVVKKTSREEPRKFGQRAAAEITTPKRTSTDAQPYMEPLRHQRAVTKTPQATSKTNVDKIISPYGLGPTDDNGLPLVGLKALRKRAQQATVETTTSQPEEKVDDFVPTDSQGKPLFGIRAIRASPQPTSSSSVHENEKTSTLKTSKTTTSHHTEVVGATNPTTTVEESYSTDISSSEDCQKMSSFKTGERKQRRTRRKELRASDGISHPSSEDENDVPPYLPNRSNRYTSKRFELQSEPSSDFVAVRNGISEQGEISPTLVKSIDSSLRHKMTTSESDENVEEKTVNLKDIIKLHESKVVTETTEGDYNRVKPKTKLRDNFEPTNEPSESRAVKTWDLEADLSTRSDVVGNIIAKHETLTQKDSIKSDKKLTGILKKTSTSSVHSTKITSSESERDESPERRFPSSERPTTPLDTNERPSKDSSKFERKTSYTEIKFSKSYPCDGDESKPLGMIKGKKTAEEKTPLTKRIVTSEITDHIVHKANTETERKTSYKTSSDKDSRVTRHQMTTSKHSVEQHSPKRERSPTSKYDLFTVDDRKSKTRSPKDTSKPVICERTKLTEKSSSDKQVTAETVYADSHHIYDEKIRSSQVKKRSLVSRTEESQESFVNRKINTIYKDSSDTDFMDKDSIEDSSSESKSERETKLRKTSQVKSRKQPKASIDKKDFAKSMANETGIFKKTSHDVDTTISHSEKYKKGENITKIYKNKEHKPMKVSSTGEKPTDRSSTEKKTITTKCYKNKVVKELEVESDTKQDRGRPIKESTDGQTSGKKSPDRRKPAGNLPDRPGLGNEPPGRQRPRKMHSDNQSSKPIKESQDIRRLNNESPRICSRRKNVLDSEVFGKEESNKRTLVKESPDTQKLRKRSPVIRSPVNESSKKHEHTYDSEDRQKRVKTSVHTQRHQSESPEGRRSGNDSQGSQSSQKETPDRRSPSKLEKKEPKVLPSEKRNDRRKPEEESYYPKQTDKRVSGKETTVNQQTKKFERKDLVKEHTEIKLSTEQPQNKKIEKELSDCRKLESREEVEKTKPKTESVERRTSKEKYGESKTEFKDYSTRKLEADKTDIYNPNFEKLYEQKPITDVKSHIRSNEYKVKEITQKSKMTVVDTEETNVDYDVSFRKNTLDRRVIKDDFVAETPERKPEKRKPDEQKIEKEEPDRQRFDKLQRTDKEDSDRRSPHRKECDKQRMENIERAHLKPHKDRPDIISPHVEKSEIYTSNKERSPHEEPYVSKLTQNNKEPDTKENIEKKRTSVDISQMRSYQEEYDHTRKTKTTYHQPTLESDETLNSKRDKEETKCEKIVKEDANTSELIISVVKEKEREGQKPERKSSKEKPTDTEVEKRRPQKAGTSIEKDEPGKGTMVLRHDDTGESLLTRKKVDMTDIEIKKSNSLNQTDKTSKDGGLHDKRKREKDEPKENRSDQEMSRRKKPDSEEPRRQKPKKEIKVKETSIEEYERNSSEKLTAVYNDSKVTQSSKTDSQLSYLSHVDKENQTIIDKFDQITPDKKISERRPSKNVLQGEKTEKTTERGNLKTVGREEHMKMSEKVTERRLKSEETERNIDMEETTRKQRKEKTETQGSAIILKTKEPDDISDEERLDTLEKEESNRTKHKMKRNEETSSKEEDQRKIKIKSDIRTKNVVEYEKRTLYKDTSKEIVDKIDIEIEYTDEYPEDKRKMNISDGKHKELEDPNLKSESEREKVKATELTEKTRLLSEQVDRKSHDKGLESKMPKGSESSKLQIEKEEPSHSKPKSFPKKFSDDIVDNLSTKNKRKSNEYQPFTVDGRIIDGNYNEKKTKTGSPKHPEETRKRKYTPDSAVKDKVPASKAPHDKTPKTSLPSRFSKSPEPDDLSTRIKKLSKQQKSSAENISQLTKRKISDTRTYSLQSLSVDSTTSSIPGYMRPCGDSRSSRSSRRHVTPERDPLDLEEYLANSYQYTRCTKRIVKPPVKYDYTYVINQDDVPAGGGGSYSIYFGPRDSIPSPKSSVTETNKYNDFKSAKGESTDTTNYRKYSSNFEAVSKDFTPQDTTCKKSITHETYPHHETETRLTSTDTDFKKENTYLDIKHQYENTVKSFDTRHASRDTPHDSSKKNYNTKEISTFTKISPEDYDAYSNIRQQYQDTVKNIADDSSFRKLSNVSTKDERENVGFVRNLVDNTYEICHKDVDTAARKYRELVTKDYKDYGITDKSISDVVMAEPGVTKTHLHGTSGSGTLRAVQGGEEDNGILTVKDKTSHTHKINQINVDQVDQQKSFGSQVYKSDPNVIHGPASRSVNDTNNMNVVDTTFKTGRDSETYYERVSDVHNKYSYQVGKEEEFTKVYKYDDSLNKKEYNYDVSDYYTQDGSPTMRAKNSFIPDYDYNKVYLPKIDKSNERPCSASNILYETIGRDDSEPISQTYQKPHRETDATKTTKQNTSSYVTFDGRLVTHETTDHSTEHKMAEPENRQVGQCVFATSTQQKGGSHPQVEKSHSATVECDSVTSFTSRALRDDVDSTHDVMRKEGRSFLDDRTKVTGISDVLSRMDASHAVDHEAKVTSDDQARSLLNKFLGAQVLMTGVESMMANAAGTKTSSHTAMTCDGDGKMVVTRNVSGEQMMKAMKDGEILREDKKSFSTGPQTITYTTSSTSPKVEGADIVKGININEVADDFELNQLLDSCEEYDERRRVRMRLKALMAEKKVLQKQLSGHEQGDTYSSSSRRIASVSGSKGSDLRTSDGNSSHSFSRGSTKVSSQKSSYSTQSSNKTYHSEGKSISAFDKFKQLDSASPKQIQNLNDPAQPALSGISLTSVGKSPGNMRASAKGPAASGPLFQLSTSLVRSASGVKDMILTWCQCRTRDYQGVKIENFSTSWNDGLAFCALIHHFYPEAFDFSSLNPKNRRHNFALAFRVADEKAGVMPLLDVEDMVMMKKPDWKCVFTYVQSLYKRLKDE